jgi:hypothetical protein
MKLMVVEVLVLPLNLSIQRGLVFMVRRGLFITFSAGIAAASVLISAAYATGASARRGTSGQGTVTATTPRAAIFKWPTKWPLDLP